MRVEVLAPPGSAPLTRQQRRAQERALAKASAGAARRAAEVLTRQEFSQTVRVVGARVTRVEDQLTALQDEVGRLQAVLLAIERVLLGQGVLTQDSLTQALRDIVAAAQGGTGPAPEGPGAAAAAEATPA